MTEWGETYEGLLGVAGVRHGFTLRVEGVKVEGERREVLEALSEAHEEARRFLGLGSGRRIGAEQVHGGEVAVVDRKSESVVMGVDGLITADEGVCLGIYVADCCAVYLVDPVRRVVGLVHAGRRGSELGIVGVAIERMREEFGCEPREMVAQLSPCIRPPRYEVEIAGMIVGQCERAGVGKIFDCEICTGGNVERYYSYRMERGKTGRMLALLALEARG